MSTTRGFSKPKYNADDYFKELGLDDIEEDPEEEDDEEKPKKKKNQKKKSSKRGKDSDHDSAYEDDDGEGNDDDDFNEDDFADENDISDPSDEEYNEGGGRKRRSRGPTKKRKRPTEKVERGEWVVPKRKSHSFIRTLENEKKKQKTETSSTNLREAEDVIADMFEIHTHFQNYYNDFAELEDPESAGTPATPATPSVPMKFNPTYYYGFGPEKSSKEALDKKSLKKTLKDFIEKGILSTVFGIDEKDIDLSELNDLDNENEEGGDEDQDIEGADDVQITRIPNKRSELEKTWQVKCMDNPFDVEKLNNYRKFIVCPIGDGEDCQIVDKESKNLGVLDSLFPQPQTKKMDIEIEKQGNKQSETRKPGKLQKKDEKNSQKNKVGAEKEEEMKNGEENEAEIQKDIVNEEKDESGAKKCGSFYVPDEYCYQVMKAEKKATLPKFSRQMESELTKTSEIFLKNYKLSQHCHPFFTSTADKQSTKRSFCDYIHKYIRILCAKNKSLFENVKSPKDEIKDKTNGEAEDKKPKKRTKKSKKSENSSDNQKKYFKILFIDPISGIEFATTPKISEQFAKLPSEDNSFYLSELRKLEPLISNCKGYIWLWIPSRLLGAVSGMVREFGFEYVDSMVWIQKNTNNSFFQACEGITSALIFQNPEIDDKQKDWYPLLPQSKLSLVLYRSRSNESKLVEIKHQRICDAFSDYVRPEGEFFGDEGPVQDGSVSLGFVEEIKPNQRIFSFIETLVPSVRIEATPQQQDATQPQTEEEEEDEEMDEETDLEKDIDSPKDPKDYDFFLENVDISSQKLKKLEGELGQKVLQFDAKKFPEVEGMEAFFPFGVHVKWARAKTVAHDMFLLKDWTNTAGNWLSFLNVIQENEN